MKRRALLASAAAALGASLGVAGRVRAAKPLASNELVLSELKLPGDPAFGRALLAVPKRLPAKPSLLVLLHGLGETHDQEVGSRAFAERYGLLSAVSRLTNPPIERTLTQDYFGAGRIEAINQRLGQRAFECPVLLCPFTPNPYKAGGEALVARFRDLTDVEIVHLHTEGQATYVTPEMQGHFRHNALFMGANVREAVNAGRADFTLGPRAPLGVAALRDVVPARADERLGGFEADARAGAGDDRDALVRLRAHFFSP